MSNRKSFLTSGAHSCAIAMSAAAVGSATPVSAAPEPQRFLLIGLVGSENPTRSNFPFAWAAALREAGNEVRIELAGDATVLMRSVVANSVLPIGWPPLRDALQKVIDLKIPIFV